MENAMAEKFIMHFSITYKYRNTPHNSYYDNRELFYDVNDMIIKSLNHSRHMKDYCNWS